MSESAAATRKRATLRNFGRNRFICAQQCYFGHWRLRRVVIPFLKTKTSQDPVNGIRGQVKSYATVQPRMGVGVIGRR